MKIIENNKIQEKVYTKKLQNGLSVMVIPKKTEKKFLMGWLIIWNINYLSKRMELTV